MSWNILIPAYGIVRASLATLVTMVLNATLAVLSRTRCDGAGP